MTKNILEYKLKRVKVFPVHAVKTWEGSTVAAVPIHNIVAGREWPNHVPPVLLPGMKPINCSRLNTRLCGLQRQSVRIGKEKYLLPLTEFNLRIVQLVSQTSRYKEYDIMTAR